MMGEDRRETTDTDAASRPADDSAVNRLEAEVADLNDRLLRALAEQQNVQRRAAREREDAVRFAASGLAKDLLATADNLRRAIESVRGDPAAQDEMTQNLLTGVATIERALLDVFERHGIRRIDPASGEPFDPHLHQAMFDVAESDYPAGTVAQVLQPGYAYHERLLRPALVGVAKEGGGGSEASDGSKTDDAPKTG